MHVAVAKIICQLVRGMLHLSTLPAAVCTRVARGILAKTFMRLPFARKYSEFDRVINAYIAADICIGLLLFEKFRDYIEAALEYQELQEMEKTRELEYVY